MVDIVVNSTTISTGGPSVQRLVFSGERRKNSIIRKFMYSHSSSSGSINLSSIISGKDIDTTAADNYFEGNVDEILCSKIYHARVYENPPYLLDVKCLPIYNGWDTDPIVFEKAFCIPFQSRVFNNCDYIDFEAEINRNCTKPFNDDVFKVKLRAVIEYHKVGDVVNPSGEDEVTLTADMIKSLVVGNGELSTISDTNRYPIIVKITVLEGEFYIPTAIESGVILDSLRVSKVSNIYIVRGTHYEKVNYEPKLISVSNKLMVNKYIENGGTW